MKREERLGIWKFRLANLNKESRKLIKIIATEIIINNDISKL